MRTVSLVLLLLWLMAFCLAVDLEPRHRLALSRSGRPTDALSVLLGDSRRLFARHMYAKADAYFHSGYYPTIFDHPSDQLHLTASTQDDHSSHEEAVDWLGQPNDWLDRFSRHFYPSEHRHLGADPHPTPADDHAGHDHDHDHDAHPHEADSQPAGGSEKELLPWLRLSATLDPERPQTYVVASYWLRSHLDKVPEAEQFLRDGLRANPGHPELLFELGRIYRENRADNERARNIWEVALANWRQRPMEERDQNQLLTAQLLGNLAKLEQETGRYPEAISYLRDLASFSPNKTEVQSWITELTEQSREPRN